MSQPGEAAAT